MNKKILLRIIKKIMDYVQENYKGILRTFYFMLSLVAVVIGGCYDHEILWLIILGIAYSSFSFIVAFVETKKEIEHPRTRYTKRNKEGDIYIEEEKLHQALIYLSMLEDQLEQQ